MANLPIEPNVARTDDPFAHKLYQQKGKEATDRLVQVLTGLGVRLEADAAAGRGGGVDLIVGYLRRAIGRRRGLGQRRRVREKGGGHGSGEFAAGVAWYALRLQHRAAQPRGEIQKLGYWRGRTEERGIWRIRRVVSGGRYLLFSIFETSFVCCFSPSFPTAPIN